MSAGAEPPPSREGTNSTVPVRNAEYNSALSLLSAETMSRACSLLLSTADYDRGDGQRGHKSGGDAQRLFSIFRRVQSAAEVVRRAEEAAAKAGKSRPQTTAGAHGGGAHPHLHQPKHHHGHHHGPGQHTTPKGRKAPIIPRGRGLAMRSAPIPPGLGISPRPTKRSISGGSSTGSDRGLESAGPGRPAKRAKLSSSSGAAPPPAALNFLAALNAQKKGSAAGAAAGPGISPKTPKGLAHPLSPKPTKQHGAGSAHHPRSPASSFPPPPPLTGAPGSPAARRTLSKPATAGRAAGVRGRRSTSPTSSSPPSSPVPSPRPPPPPPPPPQVSESPDGESETARLGRTRRSLIPRATHAPMVDTGDAMERVFDIGEDVLCQWKDGKKYEAIVKEVDFVESPGEGEGRMQIRYTIEFDDGEVCEDVPPHKVHAID